MLKIYTIGAVEVEGVDDVLVGKLNALSKELLAEVLRGYEASLMDVEILKDCFCKGLCDILGIYRTS